MSCAWFEPYRKEPFLALAPTLDDVVVERPALGAAVAVFSGEHDLATKRQVRELLTSLVYDNELVMADFSEAQFVDSSILGVLMAMKGEADERGHTLRLQLNTADIVRRAFEISGFLTIVEVAATREAALEGGR
jgi:anti-anti-sigma factor